MAEKSQHTRLAGPSHTGTEIGVVAFMTLFGAIVIGGSLQVGIDWGVEGPKAGFFPFYLGVLIIISSAVNFVQIMMARSDALFAEWGQLRRVLAVVVPTTIYVALIPYAGIYLASALLIAAFMKWLGRYGWSLIVAVSAGVPIATYLLLERWFLIPLPKGPIEDFLGL
ncbi:MAG: tripartite tricarboxylate transporter TctB family protein [Xanthobacteraceae bacterium]|nr:tripartite tricarboxylate transporter TctB family protein [Xanthobacteraceae bacterium]